MTTETVTLNAAETALLAEAVSTACSIYYRKTCECAPGVPAFGIDDQPAEEKESADLLLIPALLMVLHDLRGLKKALTNFRAKHPLVVELDMDDAGKDIATIRCGSGLDEASNLLLQAILNANVKTEPPRKALGLLERLMQPA